MKFIDQNIKFTKGVGPARAELLQKELKVFTVRDLLYLFPFRYIDKSRFERVNQIRTDDYVQLKGKLIELQKIKGKRNYRLTGLFKDESGFLELVWFRGARWVEKALKEGSNYIVYGKVNQFKGKKSIAHPEMELIEGLKERKHAAFDPVYHSTELLNAKGIEMKTRRLLIKSILQSTKEADLPENLSQELLSKLSLCKRREAIEWIHFPGSKEQLSAAKKRLKFEEIFFMQLRLIHAKKLRASKLKGWTFSRIGTHVNQFYKELLPFELTSAQKRVIKEIRADLGSGAQMNRMLQGDVGSGKTVVAVMTMLIAIDNGFQTCMMAPTEILAQQHHKSIGHLLEGLDLQMGFLSGSVTGKKRNALLKSLEAGDIDILVGTHALIEDTVKFKKLGLAITDEQHRFGVVQRSKLWTKNADQIPHILVMTATPIPRTLSMTLYGDLDISLIDELPPGRKSIKTMHKRESHRLQVIHFMHKQIEKGRQIYIVFPLIEESAKLDLQNLQVGYEQLLPYFPKPQYQISVVHGRMKPADKDLEMQRFVSGKTQIMVATTVIEVGVDVPNASVMIIENAERFGLSQLHQLRGRVGRGGEQSFCILLTGFKLTKEAKERIQTMVRTNNGFEIAEVDLRLRGPGDMEGTRQSGVKDFNMFDLIHDGAILQVARNLALLIIDEDPDLKLKKNQALANYLTEQKKRFKNWGRIS